MLDDPTSAVPVVHKNGLYIGLCGMFIRLPIAPASDEKVRDEAGSWKPFLDRSSSKVDRSSSKVDRSSLKVDPMEVIKKRSMAVRVL